MRKQSLMLIGCCLLILAVYSQNYVHERNNPGIKIKPVIGIKAYAFNLRDVKLLDKSPFKNAMDKDAAYLLEIEPDRLLYRFYKNAHLPVSGGHHSLL